MWLRHFLVPENLDVSELPISIYSNNPHGWPECEGHTHPMSHCGQRLHECSRDQLGANIFKQVDDKFTNFLKLPPLFDLTVFLGKDGSNRVYTYILYAFKGDSIVTKEVIGKLSDKSIVNFDIYKDYSIHLNLQNRMSPMTEYDNGMHYEEVYRKLNVGCK